MEEFAVCSCAAGMAEVRKGLGICLHDQNKKQQTQKEEEGNVAPFSWRKGRKDAARAWAPCLPL